MVIGSNDIVFDVLLVDDFIYLVVEFVVLGVVEVVWLEISFGRL